MKHLLTFIVAMTIAFNAIAGGKESIETMVITAANKHDDVSPEFLAAVGHIETGWRNIKSKKSSAAGVYQFTSSTWKSTLRSAPKSLGVSKRASVYDVKANTEMAAYFTQLNADFLRGKLRRDPTNGELYMAHLLGQSGSLDMIRAGKWRRAADVVPDAVPGNKRLFVDSKGRWLTVGQFRKSLHVRVTTLVKLYSPRIEKVTNDMYERELDRQKPWRHWLNEEIDEPEEFTVEPQPIRLGTCGINSNLFHSPVACNDWPTRFEAFAIRRRHAMLQA